ncbi:MAG: hypothetical protein ACRD2F_02710 [Terriglobales bacterium]
MPAYDYAALKPFEGKVVVITVLGGEVIRARANSVFDEERGLLFDLIETNRPESYKQFPPGSGFVIPWDYIEDIREVPAEESQA